MAFTGRDLPSTFAGAQRAASSIRAAGRSLGDLAGLFHDLNGAKVELDFDASETAPGR
jgi:hypothetical protein